MKRRAKKIEKKIKERNKKRKKIKNSFEKLKRRRVKSVTKATSVILPRMAVIAEDVINQIIYLKCGEKKYQEKLIQEEKEKEEKNEGTKKVEVSHKKINKK